jgi:hypothetical protein
MRMVILAALTMFLIFGCSQAPKLGAIGSAHEHADFKVYVNDVEFNFSQGKYMEEMPNSISCSQSATLAHLHDMDGDVVHKHATGVTWGYFFSTLNMSFDDSCFSTDTGERHCNSGNAKWRFYVNRAEVGGIANREMHDLEKVLITYNATDEEIARQLDTITDKAKNQNTSEICGATS